MKLLFLLFLTLAVVSGVPVQEMTAEESLALLQVEKSSLVQKEELPKQGQVVQEEPKLIAEQTHVVQKGPKLIPEQEPVVQEQPIAEQRPVVQEQPIAEQGPVVQEQLVPEEEPVVQKQPIAEQGPVVQEQPVAEQGPVVQEQPVADQGPGVQEEPADEPMQEDEIMNDDVLLGEEQWDGYVMGDEPHTDEGLGEEPVIGKGQWLSPVIGQADSLKRLTEIEKLPQRSTVQQYDMIQKELEMKEGPMIVKELWEGPVKGEGRVMEMEPQGPELYSNLPRQVGEEKGPTLAKNSLEDMNHTGWQVCGGVIISGRCYQFFKGPKKAADSEFFCQDNFLDGHLASVTSHYIHTHMMKLMAQNGGYTRTWIGGFNYLKTGRFLWLDGSRWGYTDWLPGEPNNTANVEDCVELLSNGKFNDMPCWDLRAFICSYPV